MKWIIPKAETARPNNQSWELTGIFIISAIPKETEIQQNKMHLVQT